MKCPACKKELPQEKKPREKNSPWPFCTKRCKMIDLGKWVNEEYAIPVRQAPSEEEIIELENALKNKMEN